MIKTKTRHGPRSDLACNSGFNIPDSTFKPMNIESGIPNLECEIWNLEFGIPNPESQISNLKSQISNHNPPGQPKLQTLKKRSREDIAQGLPVLSQPGKPKAPPYLTHLPAVTAHKPVHGESQNTGVRGVLWSDVVT